MWVPKWYWERKIQQQNELERRVKRLELILLKDARSKIASLSDKEAGEVYKDGYLTIEEVVNQSIETGKKRGEEMNICNNEREEEEKRIAESDARYRENMMNLIEESKILQRKRMRLLIIQIICLIGSFICTAYSLFNYFD